MQIFGFEWQWAVGVFTSVFAGLTGFWKFVIKPCFNFAKSIKKIVDIAERTIPALTEIADQFKPNSGSSLRDVIDRIEVEIDMIRSNQKALLEYQNVAIFEANAFGECIWVNSKWSELSGMNESEAYGNGWVSSIHPEDRENVFHEWNESIKSGRNFNYTYRFVNVKTQKIVQVRSYAKIQRDENRKSLNYLGTVVMIDNLFEIN